MSAFPPTRWSLVARASTPDASAREALGELLRAYWQPLYVYARYAGLDAYSAEDAVQGFCESLIRRETLRTADRTVGRLRSCLVGGFQKHLRSLHRDANRVKRGSGQAVLSLDDAESAMNLQMTDGDSPDKAFDRRWAYTLLERVLGKLRQEYVDRGRAAVFEFLEPALAWHGKELDYNVLAEQLQMSSAAVAQAVKRLRTGYRRILEQEIAETVDSPEAANEERAYLIRVLSGA
jgi:DNA-directed RNA polymerase specialized sigma24 family protein